MKTLWSSVGIRDCVRGGGRSLTLSLVAGAAAVALWSGACGPGESSSTLGTGGAPAASGGRAANSGGNSGSSSGGGTPAMGAGGTVGGAGGAIGSGGVTGGSGGVGTGGITVSTGGAGAGGTAVGGRSGGTSGNGGAVAVGGNGGRTMAGGGAGRSGVVSLFDGTLNGWLSSSGKLEGNVPNNWDIQDSAIHCAGMVRGTLISKGEYGNFRLIFHVRQLPSTGTDNHYASVLIWGTRPVPNDSIGGLQFGVPNGYHWDYRPGHNDAGAAYFVATSGGFSRTEWAQCEILANTTTGVARMACCNLGTATTCKAKEVLKFTDPTAGHRGPIALQAHSVGAHDEYKNITIEEDPTVNDLITTK